VAGRRTWLSDNWKFPVVGAIELFEASSAPIFCLLFAGTPGSGLSPERQKTVKTFGATDGHSLWIIPS
jgi:hypothetical protein